MQKTAAYIRVSTNEQATHGVSLDAQEARIQAYCTLAGLELVATIREEGVSGSKVLATRPGGQELHRLLSSGEVTHVVALKLDRLFRDALDALGQTKAWEKAGVSVHLVDMGGQTLNTGSAMGKMFLTLTAAFAELERNLISERTSQALQHKKAMGVKLGAPAMEDDNTIRRIVELRSQRLPLREIASTLTLEGRRTLKGGKWAPQTVKNILDREGALTQRNASGGILGTLRVVAV